MLVMFSSHIPLYFNLTCLMFDTTNIYHCLWISLPVPGQDMLNFKCIQNLQYLWTYIDKKSSKKLFEIDLEMVSSSGGSPHPRCSPPICWDKSFSTSTSSLRQRDAKIEMESWIWISSKFKFFLTKARCHHKNINTVTVMWYSSSQAVTCSSWRSCCHRQRRLRD